MDRRRFLASSSLLALGVAGGWELSARRSAEGVGEGFAAGPVRHLLPAASHERIRLKVSFVRARDDVPVLSIGDAQVAGERTDTRGRFWSFDRAGLEPGTDHRLRLHAASGEPLTDPWPLATLPAPDAAPGRVRLLLHTCAGGPPFVPDRRLGRTYLPIGVRRRLLARGLAFEPDVLVANGDHVYWDLTGRGGWMMGSSPMARWRTGLFERGIPVLGTGNERVLTAAFDPQIAVLYGTLLRSTPVLFVQDDHDRTENDEWSGDHGTFPAGPFMRSVADATQRLYYPEFLPAEGLPDSSLDERQVGRLHGTLRFGRLLETLVYDCRGELTLGPDGSFLAGATERWVTERSRISPADWVAHVPSGPFGWSAGKWLEWYPDVLDRDGRLRADLDKPGWSQGFLEQHERLLAATAERDAPAVLLGGDLHATAAGRISRGAEVDLSRNPAVALLVGTLGTGGAGWPSQERGTLARPSGVLTMDELVPADERNGFTLLDVTRDEVVARLFVWSPRDGVGAIDRLEPAHTLRFPRSSG